MFISTDKNRPRVISFFGEKRSPRIPLIICPVPYVTKLPVNESDKRDFEIPVAETISEIIAP